MQKIIINTDGIKENEIDETAIRAKALIINDQNEILLGYGFKAYQFIGGHVNENEKIEDGLLREIKEETGIEIDHIDSEPFMKIIHYTRNYRNSGKTRENIIYYYYIKCNSDVNLNNIDYDEWERKGNFEVKKVLLENVEQLLVSNKHENEMSELIVEEMLEVLKEFKKINK